MFCGKQLLSIFCGSNLMISGKGILHVWGDVTRSSFFRTLLTWLFFNRQISAASARKKSYKYVFYISGQMFLLDRFFDGTFFTYGIEVMSFADRDQEDRIDPMIYVFPRMTKCTFHKFGTSGNIEKHDALCILPLNIVNEKIYIFIWFWLLLLGALSFLVLVYRVVIIFSPYIRAFVLRLRYRRVKRECIGKVFTRRSVINWRNYIIIFIILEMVIGKSYVGDWFLIYLMGQNIDSVIFKDVIHELAKKLGYRSRDMGEWLEGNSFHHSLIPSFTHSSFNLQKRRHTAAAATWMEEEIIWTVEFTK